MIGSIYGRFYIKSAHFVAIRWQTWPPQAILVSEWLISKKSSLQPLGQTNWHLIGSIYGRSSIKIVHFVSIRWQTWPPQAILVSDWLISKKSSPLKPSSSQMNWSSSYISISIFLSEITGANGPYMIFISLGNKYIAARPIMVWLTETSTFFFPENKYLFIRTTPYGFVCQSNIKATRFSFWQWTNA